MHKRILQIGGVLLLVLAGILLGRQLMKTSASIEKKVDIDESAVPWQGEKTRHTGQKQKGITIPAFGSITLRANTLEQAVSLFNPESNDCYFVISLYLPDKTEIWKSKMILPGKGLYQIRLKQKVAAGKYENSIVRYECYKMDKQLTKLNGSDVKLELEVR